MLAVMEVVTRGALSPVVAERGQQQSAEKARHSQADQRMEAADQGEKGS